MMVRVPAGKTFDSTLAELNRRRPIIREATLPPAAVGPNAGYLANDFKLIPASTGRSTLRRRFAEPLTIVLIIAAGVLLIACANIASLMLARATSRRHEMGLRLALGASRGRLVRQLLAEGLLLVLGGSLAGLALARTGGELLVRQLGSAVNLVTIDLSIDWRVLGFTAVIALVTTLFFGLAPATGLSAVTPNEALREHHRSVVGDRRLGLRNALVIAQVALSLVLVIGAGLFVRTFHALMTTPLGFQVDDRLIVNVDVQRSAVHPERWLSLYERLAEAAAAAPGVRRVSSSYTTPLSNRGQNDRLSQPHRADLTPQQRVVFQNAIAPGWFATYGRRILQGRDLAPSDVQGADRVTVVNETFVRRFLGDQPPVGQTIAMGEGTRATSFVIVGVVNDALYTTLRAGVVPTAYMPLAQVGPLSARFALTAEVTGDRGRVIEGLKAAIAGVDPNVAFAFRDYGEQVRAMAGQERLVAMLSGFFGALALLLAALGLYGVTSYSVNLRRPEIAVRMALGADAGGVVRMVLRRVATLVALGAAFGIGLSLWATTFVRSLLFHLDARDPATFAFAIAVLLAVALVAGWLPARRASQLDPTTILRE